jgi:hypothetical protein
LHLLTAGYGTTRTTANAGTCPLLVEADIGFVYSMTWKPNGAKPDQTLAHPFADVLLA